MRSLSEASISPQAQDASAPHAARPLRRSTRWIANVIAPGAGLILVGRVWRGASLALVFTLTGVTACAGFWIVPLSIPPALRWGALATALVSWLVAQASLNQACRDEPAPPHARPDAGFRHAG